MLGKAEQEDMTVGFNAQSTMTVIYGESEEERRKEETYTNVVCLGMRR